MGPGDFGGGALAFEKLFWWMSLIEHIVFWSLVYFVVGWIVVSIINAKTAGPDRVSFFDMPGLWLLAVLVWPVMLLLVLWEWVVRKFKIARDFLS